MVAPAGFNYNEAMAQSWNEQLLLNLVRLRHNEPPFFLEPTQVTTGYTFSRDLKAAADLKTAGGADDTLGFNGGIAFQERPSISYKPLTGEDFTKKMLRPISAETLILLARSGWSVKTIVLALVQEINGLSQPYNIAQIPSSPLHRVAALLQDLQESDNLIIQVASEDNSRSRLVLQRVQSDKATEVGNLLQLAPGLNEFEISRVHLRQGNEISIIGRSLLDALRHLSLAIDPPEGRNCLNEILCVHRSSSKPRHAFVSVKHGRSWYAIANDDSESKAVLGLLTQLFSLQSTGGSGMTPLLTIPQ